MSPAGPRGVHGDVLIVQPIHEAGVTRLEAVGLTVRYASSADMRVVRDEIGDAVAVITRSAGLSSEVIEAGTRLRVIGNHGSGLDAIDLEAAARRGVPVVRTPGANAVAVAEMTVALMLATLKRVCEADRAARTGDDGFKYRVPIGDLSGATVGIVGMGSIGQAVAGMLHAAFGVQLLVHTRTPDAATLARWEARPVDLGELAERSDVVTLHLPANPDGHPLVDGAFLSRMNPSAVLINTARGSLVDEDALAVALAEGRIAGAGLDVMRGDRLDPLSPIASAPNVVLSPHIAGSSVGALRQTAVAVADAVIDALASPAGDPSPGSDGSSDDASGAEGTAGPG